ncbi:MAG: hypothetical protein ACRDRT_12370, partial [Pseudonocardiaceae bacterium]
PLTTTAPTAVNSTKPTLTVPENIRGVEFTDSAPDRREELTLIDAGGSEVVRTLVTCRGWCSAGWRSDLNRCSARTGRRGSDDHL